MFPGRSRQVAEDLVSERDARGRYAGHRLRLPARPPVGLLAGASRGTRTCPRVQGRFEPVRQQVKRNDGGSVFNLTVTLDLEPPGSTVTLVRTPAAPTGTTRRLHAYAGA